MPIEAPPTEVAAVIVQAPRLPPLAGEAAFSVETFDAKALSRSPRLDVALKRSPGVSLFRRTGSDAANPTIQGLSLRAVAPSGAGRALVTLDGAPQNDPFGGWVIWSALPGEGLDGAAVIRGAGAGPYGAGALTGVVALREAGARDGLSALSVSAGGRGSYRAAAALGTQNLLVVASGSSSDGYVPVRGARAGAADTPTTLSDAAISARLQGGLGQADWAVRLGAYEERRGAGLVGARSIASGGSLTLTAARAPSDEAAGWRVQAWLRSSDLKNTSVAVGAGRALTTPANDQYATPALGYGVNAAWQARSGPWSWELGADFRAAEGEVRERFRLMNGAFTRGRIAGGETLVGGAYAEAVYDGGDLLVTGGARIDGWRSSEAVRRERDLASGAVLLDLKPADNSGTTPTARFGLRHRLTGDTWLRGAAYAGFRPPSLNELHRPFRVGNDVTEANSGLTPETLYGAEAGFSGEGVLSWNLSVFYNRLDDPITNVTIGFGPGTFPTAGFIPAGGVLRQRRNAGQIEAWGIEADVSAELGAALTARAALSAVKAEVDGGASAAQLTGKRPAQTPEITITAGADWRASERLTLALDLRYEGERFEDDLNSRKLAPALGVDLRADWRVSAATEVYLAAENLLDAEIEVGETADGVESFTAPRLVRIGVSIRR
ncbi:TonB-dependent receptor [Phenylobacterium sp.]|uniref:TonB-dependent receptor n=1 Tax=Phenylobacterium sp. TaxID=1871053 RepID=UPI0027356DEB|nr:TonB-dependent receptor [Phenylobacterium sp.]MDP3856104.1 TonB-dependent receptor [Phenylobacterium sp.]